MGKSSLKRTLLRKVQGTDLLNFTESNSTGLNRQFKAINSASAFLIPGSFLLLTGAFLLAGCAPISKGKSNSMQAGQESVELARRNITYSEGDAGYNLQLIERGQFSELEIAFNSDNQSAPVLSSLENPARLVIDLDGALGPKAETIETPESLYINRIRVGEHPGKSRVVLDLSPESQVSSEMIAGLPGQYTLRLASAAQGSTNSLAKNSNEQSKESEIQVASLNQEPAAEVVKEIALASEDGKDKAEISEKQAEFSVPQASEQQLLAEAQIAQESMAQESMAQPEEEIFNAQSNSKIEAEKIEAVKNNASLANIDNYELQSISASENTLIIRGNELKNFSFKKTAPSEYVLTLPETTMSAEAKQSVVAPAGTGAIRSVRAKTEDNNSVIRIFADAERSLQAENSPNGVVISASSNNFETQALRAQASDKMLEAEQSVDDEIAALLGDKPKYSGRLISLDLQDTDIDNALRIIAEVSNLNIIASEEVAGKITLRLVDVPWDQALDVILKTNGLDMIQENNVVRIAPVERLRTERESLKQARQAEEDLEPLSVRYVRISYAKAAELKPLVESVISERGTVAYDERTNQLIVKDIRKGIVNVAELIAKLDLRTPQVLLETQIVEATTSLARELGSEFGFNYVQSPETGNATGYNFPNTVATGGASGFPVDNSSAITLLLESADGTRSLATRLTALETEGRVKVVSRPAVATTNNKQATIKSVETIRIKQPDGGLSVATGQGASANGTGTATEEVEIGIILEVTPQASPDYFVLLDINAKSSTLGSTVVDGIPSEIERSATSSVLVSSGQTFAMGGIYKTSDSNTIEGVPFLKDVPVLGTFFRRTFMNSQDEELLFFITPRIIEGSFDDATMKAS